MAAMLAVLAPTVDRTALLAGSFADTELRQLAALPATAGPLLDILAERHDDREMSLFAS
jgi:hypothetical protein